MTDTVAAAVHDHHHDEPHNDIIYPATVPFVLVHLACLGVFWSGVTTTAVVMAVVLYLVRMWALTAGFHRYFSHRSYKTSRVFQFVLAFLAQMSAQRGVLWWAAIHRHHHRHSDTELDVHSPRHMGFFHSHVGWIFRPSKAEADYSSVQDLTRYPELVWLDRLHLLPAVLLAVATFLVGGWPGLVVGFFWSTVVLYHCTFFINSLAHVVGKQRYVTGDDSRNNWWLALITLGEGWHNNHHYYQSAAPQGWRWYEVDISYYVLKAMSWVGLVWDLRKPPEKVVMGEQKLGRKVIEKVAHQVAFSFNTEAVAEQVRAALSRGPTLDEVKRKAQRAREDAEARLASLSVPHLPDVEELRRRARELYAESPSLDEVAERAREILQQTVSRQVMEKVMSGV